MHWETRKFIRPPLVPLGALYCGSLEPNHYRHTWSPRCACDDPAQRPTFLGMLVAVYWVRMV